jgi:hypothetical protein
MAARQERIAGEGALQPDEIAPEVLDHRGQSVEIFLGHAPL